MVAQSLPLPNLRKSIVPRNPDYMLLNCDLKGADAQVVAWDAHDEILMAAFKAGIDVHTKNAEDATNVRPITKYIRSTYKVRIHATHYYARPRTLARNFGTTVHEEEQFQKRWFQIHPAIAEWHERVQAELDATRTVYNKFGYRMRYYDRPQNLLKEALAWIGQSTTAISCERGGLKASKNIPWLKAWPLQVHDSWVFEILKSDFGKRHLIRDQLETVVPYDDPLIIPWEIEASEVSWGDCTKIEWE